MYDCKGFGVDVKEGKFRPVTFQRNECGDNDVQFDVKYCGICHSDVHEWSDLCPDDRVFPLVPGHELAGVVTAVGKNVIDVKVGEPVGVGCFVDCCNKCEGCDAKDENMCTSVTPTYGYAIQHGGLQTNTGWTIGGYSNSMTVNRRFCFKIPESYPLEKAGPVFCSAITMYTPLKVYGALEGGKRVGIAGLGGLGQMGVRLAKAMGNTVVVFSTSPQKKEKALAIGADEFVITTDEEQMAACKKVHLLIDSISHPHDLNRLVGRVRNKGHHVLLGLILEPAKVYQMGLFGLVHITASMVGNCADTQECMDFVDHHQIYSEIQLVTWDKIDDIYQKLLAKNDGITRYVLDIEASLAAASL